MIPKSGHRFSDQIMPLEMSRHRIKNNYLLLSAVHLAAMARPRIPP
jgi:hypothetical protein